MVNIMLTNRLRKPNENGDEFIVSIVAIVLMVIFGLVLIVTVLVPPGSTKKYDGPSPRSTQIVLKMQGYDLDMDEVTELLGDYKFAVKGGRGPDATVTLGDDEEIEVYMFVELTEDHKVQVLKYQSDDTIVGNPKNVPQRPVNAW
jgi:hypothetical protein